MDGVRKEMRKLSKRGKWEMWLGMKVENGARVERVTNGEIKVTVKKISEWN